MDVSVNAIVSSVFILDENFVLCQCLHTFLFAFEKKLNWGGGGNRVYGIGGNKAMPQYL